MAATIAIIQATATDFLKVAPEQISNPDKISLYWSPITALVLVIAGIVVLVMKAREKRFTHR